MKDARLASILSMLRQSCWGEPPPRRFLAGGVACALAGATATPRAPSGAASMRALAGGRHSGHPRPGPPLVREDGAPLLVEGRGTAAHRGDAAPLPHGGHGMRRRREIPPPRPPSIFR